MRFGTGTFSLFYTFALAVRTTNAFVVVRSPAKAPIIHTPLRRAYRETHQLQHRHYSFLSGLFEAPSIASEDQVRSALKNKKAILVDVRSQGEIASNGKVQVHQRGWLNAPGTPFGCTVLQEQADQLLPDKSVPIILYCASGKRAQKAKSILEEQGYKQVLNAGGAKDLKSYL